LATMIAKINKVCITFLGDISLDYS